MTHDFQQSGDGGVLTLKGALTIENAAELKSAVAEALDASTGLVLELAEVDTADLSCLQLLCSAHRTAVRDGKSLELRNAGGGFIAMTDAAGYGRHLGCMNRSRSDCLWLEAE